MPEQKIKKLKQTICDVAHELWQQNLVYFPDANISMLVDGLKKDGEKDFLVTATGCDKRKFPPKNERSYDSEGHEIYIGKNQKKPTKDFPTHLAIYEATGYEARAVLHSHGFYTIKYAKIFNEKGLNHPLGKPIAGKGYSSTDQARLGMVAITEEECAGIKDIADKVKDYVENSRAIVVPTSGSYIYSKLENPIEALWNCLAAAIYLEKCAEYEVQKYYFNNHSNKIFDGTGMLKKMCEIYKGAGKGTLPLVEQVLASGLLKIKM